MAIQIAVLKETGSFEKRVAAIPETVKKLIAKGFEITIETGAGNNSSYPDQDYVSAGAKIAASAMRQQKMRILFYASMRLKTSRPKKAPS